MNKSMGNPKLHKKNHIGTIMADWLPGASVAGIPAVTLLRDRHELNWIVYRVLRLALHVSTLVSEEVNNLLQKFSD
jgi:hypothetical protein